MEVVCAGCGCTVDRAVVLSACTGFPVCCCGGLAAGPGDVAGDPRLGTGLPPEQPVDRR